MFSKYPFWFDSQNENRKGRFFFVSTSIVSTTSQCFVTDTTLTACAAKRKRSMIVSADDSEGLNTDEISPMVPDRLAIEPQKVKEYRSDSFQKGGGGRPRLWAEGRG